MNNKIKCLFGYHEYTLPDERNPDTLICKHCRRFGYAKYPNGNETWREYNDKGRVIFYRTSYGTEIWYDNAGHVINYKIRNFGINIGNKS